MKHMAYRAYTLWDGLRLVSSTTCLRRPDQSFQKFRCAGRSWACAWLALFAVERLEQEWIETLRETSRRNLRLVSVEPPRTLVVGVVQTVNRGRLRSTHVADDRELPLSSGGFSERVLDPDEFLARYGIRSLSKTTRSASISLRRAVCRLRAGRGRSPDSRAELETGEVQSGSRPACLPLDRIAAQAGHGIRPRRAR